MRSLHDPDGDRDGHRDASAPRGPRHDTPDAIGPRRRPTTDATAASPIGIYRDLGAQGLAPAEAGNLTAYLRGIRPVAQGWTVAEINRLLFLRHLVDRGRIGS